MVIPDQKPPWLLLPRIEPKEVDGGKAEGNEVEKGRDSMDLEIRMEWIRMMKRRGKGRRIER
jgi:hypothetical protein